MTADTIATVQAAYRHLADEARNRQQQFDDSPLPKIHIGMATCGIASGALDTQAAFETALAERGIEARPVFVTVDPVRDTPEVLAAYTDNFHDRMIGLNGSEDQVAAAARAWRVVYQALDDDPEFYTVNHSAFSYITLPGEGVVDFVRRDDSPEAVAERMACFVAASGG